uniref:heparosan-N-sulfate-glucuronate 5-epimerase n=1 Tax=Timema monikensis TaxID=170555 RepID=A0A7R9E2C0_9NEOP|nr:unnamed protein product [Timema monikensis]
MSVAGAEQKPRGERGKGLKGPAVLPSRGGRIQQVTTTVRIAPDPRGAAWSLLLLGIQNEAAAGSEANNSSSLSTRQLGHHKVPPRSAALILLLPPAIYRHDRFSARVSVQSHTPPPPLPPRQTLSSRRRIRGAPFPPDDVAKFLAFRTPCIVGTALRPMSQLDTETLAIGHKKKLKIPAFNHEAIEVFPMMIRTRYLKVSLMIICISGFLTVFYVWTRCGEVGSARHRHMPEWDTKKTPNIQDSYVGDPIERGANDLQGYEEIDCHINGEFTVGCRKEGGEVYLPFSFLHKYFEVYGKLATYDGYERFEWSHSYSKVYYPKGKYDPRGVFMYFENYNVEVRERVKCVTAIEGVPVSTQWEVQGYYYPTQIAQFGLSHYSKNLTEPEPRSKVFEDGDKELASWEVPVGASLSRVLDAGVGSYVAQFNSPDSLPSGVFLKVDHVLDFILSLNLKLSGNSSFTVVLQNREKREVFHLHYIFSDLLISAQDQHIYHGIGLSSGWRRITRDLIVDLQKGLVYQNKPKRKLSRSKFKVMGLIFRGSGSLDNLTLSSSEHLAQFYDAARWFVRHQDPSTGGWPNPVKRRVAPGMADLEPGWYSAMGQGHAISVLARAYHHSGGDPQYLRAAVAALRPFRVTSAEGGVLSSFLGKFPWYEEYPTIPASFVLNGFIYSLLGLYDLKTISSPDYVKEAADLFDQGMSSLKRLLLLYDTGSGTSYDLRHFTLGSPPNLARWDYHATHVNQLLLLATIDRDPLLTSTAERWIGYMNGKRAAHN